MTIALALIALVAPSIHNPEVGMTASKTPKTFRLAKILKSLLALFFRPKVLLKLLNGQSRLELDSIYPQEPFRWYACATVAAFLGDAKFPR